MYFSVFLISFEIYCLAYTTVYLSYIGLFVSVRSNKFQLTWMELDILWAFLARKRGNIKKKYFLFPFSSLRIASFVICICSIFAWVENLETQWSSSSGWKAKYIIRGGIRNFDLKRRGMAIKPQNFCRLSYTQSKKLKMVSSPGLFRVPQISLSSPHLSLSISLFLLPCHSSFLRQEGNFRVVRKRSSSKEIWAPIK